MSGSLTVSVSQRLFSSQGLLGKLKSHDEVSYQDHLVAHDRNALDIRRSLQYLISRLTRLEVILGARDFNLHPGVVEASQRVFECTIAPVQYLRCETANTLQ